ncbi:sulfurtransferase [Agrococcus terreus]|uniref:sulfurtransferase n=1 Tax=Agrococcus terreus TaxID=574649 RepID=UPI0038515DE1
MRAIPDLVDVEWLRERLGEPGLVVVDASIALFGIPDESVPGARRFAIDGAMSADRGGVHDLPTPDDLQAALRALGIHEDDRVVAVDAAGITGSARAWWMLRSAGIDAAVLDGGVPAWTAAGLPLERVRDAAYEPGDVIVRWQDGGFVGADAVDAALADGGAVLDARAGERFRGEAPEPREGVRGGHMPGAASLPFASLQDGGRMLPADELRARLDEAAGDRPIVASCGSGVTACVIALAATLAGREGVAVYDGSWAEWGAEGSGRPVVTGA